MRLAGWLCTCVGVCVYLHFHSSYYRSCKICRNECAAGTISANISVFKTLVLLLGILYAPWCRLVCVFFLFVSRAIKCLINSSDDLLSNRCLFISLLVISFAYVIFCLWRSVSIFPGLVKLKIPLDTFHLVVTAHLYKIDQLFVFHRLSVNVTQARGISDVLTSRVLLLRSHDSFTLD